MMNNISKSMQEVWEIKEACYEEVKDLKLKDALKKRLRDSMDKARELGFEIMKNDKKVALK